MSDKTITVTTSKNSDKKITVNTTPKNRIVVTKGGSYSGIDTLVELKDVDASNTSNNFVPVYDGSVNKFVIKEVPFVNSSFQTANAAFDKANAANVLAYTVGINANAWANTKVSSVLGTAGQIYSSGGTTPTINLISTGVTATSYGGANQIPVITVDIFGRLTAAANVTVQGMDYPYANTIGASSNAYARTIVDANLIVSRAYTNTSTAAANNYAGFMANSVNGYAETIVTSNLITARAYTNTSTAAANNYAGVMANSANAYAFATYGTITNTVAAFAAANQAGVVANNANAYAGSTYVKKAGDTITGDLVVQGNVTISGNTTYVNTQTLLIGDSLITLNNDIPTNIAPSEDAGIEIKRGSSANVSLLWNEGSDKWTFTNDGTNYRLIASNTDVESANNYAGAIANTKLANTSGVSFAGNLYFPTGNVGIGTTAPVSNLHIKGSSAGILLEDPATSSSQSMLTRVSGNYLVYEALRANRTVERSMLSIGISWGTNIYIGTAEDASIDVDILNRTRITSGKLELSTDSGTWGSRIQQSNYFTYFNARDGYKFDVLGAEKVRVDSLGNIGVGTSSPAYTLDVNGVIQAQSTGSASMIINPASGNYAQLLLQNAGTTRWRIRHNDTEDYLSFYDERKTGGAGSQLVIKDTTGNVGIGTTSPAYKLDVNGSIGFNGDIVKTSGDNFNFIVNSRTVIGGAGSGVQTIRSSSSGLNVIHTDTSATRLFISDNIGIGTTSPSAKLHVVGDTIFTGNVTVSGNTTYMNTQTLLIGDNILTLNADLPSNLPAIEDAGIEVNRGAYGNASIIWDETNDRWDVRANNNTYVTITESGRVGVGTTSPSEILTVSKSSSGLTVFPHLFLENLDGTDGGVRFYADGDGGGGIITFGSKVSTFAVANGRPSHLTTDHPGRKAGIFNYQNGTTNDTSAFLFGNSDAGTNQPIGWKVAVTANGRIGVGTTLPNSTLHVVGTANITSNLVVQGYDVVPTMFALANACNNWANSISTGGSSVGNSTNTQVIFNNNGYANGSNDLVFIKDEGLLIANVISSNTMFVGRNQMDSTQIMLGAAGSYTIDKFLSSSAKAVQYNLVFESEDRQYHSTQISLLHNDGTSYITEYATLNTGNNLATITSSLSSMNVYLNVATTYANTVVNIFRVATGIDPRPSYYNALLNADGDPVLARDGSGIVLRS